MPGKLNVYQLGEIGINLVESAIHVKDGTLLSAQNAQLAPIDGDGAIRKRDGMAKLNAVAAAGAILAGCAVPMTDPAP